MKPRSALPFTGADHLNLIIVLFPSDKGIKINCDIRNSYNKISQKWCDFRKTTAINKCIAEFCERLKPGSKILDIGCGGGYPIDAYLANKGFSVTGIDLSEEMITRAKQLNLQGATFIADDILNYSTAEKYDAVIAFDSLWHITYAMQESTFRIISDLLKRGGLCIFTYGKTDGEIMGTMFGEQFYYSSLGIEKLKFAMQRNSLEILDFALDYKETTTGERDLIAIVRKI